MIRVELSRALCNRYFVLACAVNLLALSYGFYYYNPPQFDDIRGMHLLTNNAYDTWLFAHASSPSLLAPLVAVLPYADSYALDGLSGYSRFVLLRSSHMSYLFAKFLANSLAAGIAVALPLVILFGYTNLKYPRNLPPVSQSRIPFEQLSGPFGDIYRSAPDFYILFLIALALLFGITYGTLGLFLSSLFHNRYVALAGPFVLYFIANFILAVLGLEEWTPPSTLVPHSVNSTSSVTVFGELGGILVLSLLGLAITKSRFRDHA